MIRPMIARRPSSLLVLASLALSGASVMAACSSDSKGPSASSGGSSSTAGGSAGKASSGGSHHGASGGADNNTAGAGEGGEAGSPVRGDGGAAGEEPGTVVEVPPAACSETAKWMGAAPLAGVSTTADERLLSVTADELDLAFLRDGALYVAHRASTNDDFDAGTAVTLPAGYVADAGVALSADGLTLVLVSSNGQSFASLARSTRSANFGETADPSAFQALNARAVQTLEHFAAPVLAPDGKSFVFSGFTPGQFGNSVVYESLWVKTEWDMPRNISQSLFDGSGDKRPLPTGLSSDSRTLFYFDEAQSKELARFRDRPDAPLYDTIDLGALNGAVPNLGCNRLYYSNAGDISSEVD
jgi:hypothetical protein